LKLTEDQAKAVARHWEERREAFRKFRGLEPGEWRAKFEELADQEKTVLGLLRPDQATRLRQIVLQQQGANAFADPSIVAALGLTPAQQEKIRALQEETHQSVWAVARSATFRPEDWKKVEESWRKTRGDILGTLTGDQKERWKELTGAAFTGEVRAPYRGGFGPRHGTHRGMRQP
jgi:hypothetical protein